MPLSVAVSEGLPTSGPDGEKLTAKSCGHWFDPLSGVEGKSRPVYMNATAMCNFEYANGAAGNIGTLLLQCTLPQGYLVATGQSQSTNCKAEDGSPHISGPQNPEQAKKALLQFYGFNSLSDVPCKYCVLEDDS